MKSHLHVSTLLLLISITACGKGGDTTELDTRKFDSAATDSVVASTHADTASYYIADPELKQVLRKELFEIQRRRDADDRSEGLEGMIVDLQALFHTLTVTARALDRSKMFTNDIETEISRFNSANHSSAEESSRMLNGLRGTYSMYAMLAKMRFLGRDDAQRRIQEIHDSAVEDFGPESKPMQTAAAAAHAYYMLMRLIMRDVDTDRIYDEAFQQIDQRYREGKEVARTDEDRYINGMYRVFEISQLWAISLSPSLMNEVSEMSSLLAHNIADAANVGEQLVWATEFLYRISLRIAEETITLIL